jgi:hypothetical protein
LEEFFKLFGLGVPFYLGGATYGVFWWLDSNASDEVTQVISLWLRGRSQHKLDLGNLIINAFDRVYTSSLLTFRAFQRSAAISSIIWLLAYFMPWSIQFRVLLNESELWDVAKNSSFITLFVGVAITLPFVILSDYISLFVVRGLLVDASAHPIKASIGAFAVGYFIITSLLSFLVSTIFYIVVAQGMIVVTKDPAESVIIVIKTVLFILFGDSFLGIFAPALIIHLWLPLFTVSSLAVRLAFWIFRVVEWAQWFLKQGDAHPFKAIGIVATLIVFVGAMLVKEGWALLSVLERT